MSFEDFETYPDEPRRPSQSGCIGKFLPILIVAMFTMWVLQKISPGPERQQKPRAPQGQRRQQTRDFQIDPVSPRIPTSPDRSRSETGDWSIEEVETTNSNRTGASRSEPTSTTEGDWSIEEVETVTSGAQKEQADINDPKSTKEGDWEIEEVESGGKP